MILPILNITMIGRWLLWVASHAASAHFFWDNRGRRNL